MSLSLSKTSLGRRHPAIQLQILYSSVALANVAIADPRRVRPRELDTEAGYLLHLIGIHTSQEARSNTDGKSRMRGGCSVHRAWGPIAQITLQEKERAVRLRPEGASEGPRCDRQSPSWTPRRPQFDAQSRSQTRRGSGRQLGCATNGTL